MKRNNTIVDILRGETIKDPMFGDLELNRAGTERFWTGKIIFAPTNDQIRVNFWYLEDAVANIQKNFYRELENGYSELSNSIGKCLHKEYLRAKGELAYGEVWNVFKLVGFTFPSASELVEGSFEWDMFYSYDPDKPDFLVEMKNWLPEECYSGE